MKGKEILYSCSLFHNVANEEIEVEMRVFESQVQVCTVSANMKISEELTLVEFGFDDKKLFLRWEVNQTNENKGEEAQLIGLNIIRGDKKYIFYGQNEPLKTLKANLDNRIPYTSFNSVYQPIQVIHQTSQGQIQLVRNRLTSTFEVAKILKVKKRGSHSNDLVNQELILTLYFTNNQHVNLVSLRCYFIDEAIIALIFEYYKVSSLHQYILHHKGSIPLEKVRKIMKRLLKAVEYMHKNQIMHRDLKLDNIVMKSFSDPKSVKIIDYGFATETKNRNYYLFRCGTIGYIAPEILQQSYYTELCDIYSLAVIFYQLLTGKSLLKIERSNLEYDYENKQGFSKLIHNYQECLSPNNIFKQMEGNLVNQKISQIKDQLIKDLLLRMLSPEQTRINARECLEHEFFNNKISFKITQVQSICIRNPFNQ